MSSTIAHIRRRTSLTVGLTAVAVGVLAAACGSHGTPAPTTTTTTTTTSAAANSGGHHGHDSSGGGGGGSNSGDTGGGGAPVPADTGSPSTVTNTETDVQTTVQTSVQTSVSTQTVTQTPNPRDQYGHGDSRNQGGPGQGH